MLVGVNTLGIKPGWAGGEELYLRNVLAKLTEFERSVNFVVFTDAENHASFSDYECIQVDSASGLNKAASDAGVDLLYSSLLRAPSSPGVPLALYSMELDSIVSGGNSRKRGKGGRVRVLRQICSEVGVFVTPSAFMRQQLLDIFEVPLNKTIVAPLGVSETFASEQQCIVEQPFILCVGRTTRRKNIDFLLEAFERASRDIPHALVVVGQPCDAEREEWGARIVRIDRLPSPQLAGLYQHCDLFVCPSLYEGSGVTILEAFKSGALVATGRVGGITEVASDVPIFFNAESVDSLVGALRRGVNEEIESRERRVRSGRRLADEYTWERCATQTLTAFRRALR